MRLHTLPKTKNLQGKRVLVRVDWNIPLDGSLEPEASLKVERSLLGIKALSKRGAIVIVMTHLGRPKKRETSLSTKQLVPLLRDVYGLSVMFHGEGVSDASARKKLSVRLVTAEPGTIHLLENVRFEVGEEKNLVSLAKAYASLADVFVNDAFASCHRAHASVVGVAKLLPAFAGLALIEEVKTLSVLLKQPKRPFVAVLGGKKLTTKLPIILALLKRCDAVMVGGAMAHTCLRARGLSIGASYIEDAGIQAAKKLVKATNLYLPEDAMVATKLAQSAVLRRVAIKDINKKDIMVDLGHATMKEWAKRIQSAQTILWNGPVGVSEIKSMGAGSRFLARVIGGRAKGAALGIAGGGDTIPVIMQTQMQTNFDFISTGGGAMLEFLVQDGRLPGLQPLKKPSKEAPKSPKGDFREDS